ncbi:hypothetical protein Skr01_67610 [Sphaerisporangium krabiense]|uniref:Uncharacterized protein n=1 Tax=Sphaerisporangium krabiense TaxID=763782 RepID=A0A7W8Z3N4_9ACTN|nr:hypothetical protein [Sphaerisporangium krabiense]MBB5626877.1 hypothetical protein [Sphaerisporangium krabiense]GII66676.1 hypothetical protein Skr01_67610 [Sphaerisporangium krabiense]
MRGIEERLRQGMTEATRPVRGAPELAVRVTARVALRRRRRRLAASVTAAAAAVLVVVGVMSSHIVTRPDPVATSPELDGVRIGYIPEGLGAPRRLRAQEKDRNGAIRLRGEALRWQAGRDFVQVTVYRTHGAVRDALDILAMNVLYLPVEPRYSSDPVVSGDGTSSMWVADYGLVLKVAVSVTLKGERDRIADALRLVGWNPAFAGIRVSYMPAGMWVSGTGADSDVLSRFWRDGAGRRVSIDVVYGRGAATLEKLRAAGQPPEVLTDVRPASVRGRPAYAATTGQGGPALLWLVKPGIGVRIRGDHLPEGDLVRIAEGIQSPPESQGESVDGIAISLAGLDLRPGPVETAVAARWRSTTRRWTGADGKDAVTVSIQRGAGLLSSVWWESVSRGEPKPATVAGVQGHLLDTGISTTSRKFTWTPVSGLAIVVTAPAPDLRRIVKGVAVP